MKGSIAAAAFLTLSLAHAGYAVAQSALRPSSTIRVTTPNIQLTGRFVAADSGLLIMKPSGRAAVTIANSEITRIEVRGNHAAEGAKVLGVTGLIGGAAFGAFLGYALCETPSCDNDVPLAMGAVGVAFGAGGVFAGAIIGLGIPKWTPIEPSRVLRTSNAPLRLSVAPTLRVGDAKAREIGLRFALGR